jgi:hypothetical protein
MKSSEDKDTDKYEILHENEPVNKNLLGQFVLRDRVVSEKGTTFLGIHKITC